jgi:hypothetical protein
MIKDKSIPLMERWKIFNNSDDDFKNQQDWLYRAKGVGMKYIMDNWLDAPEVYGRGKTIIIKDLFEEVVYGDELNYTGYKLNDEKMKQILISALEEILESNLSSFKFDW